MLTGPRAGGGIGRRSRLRALWANSPWRFESSPAHDESPVFIGVFASSPSSPRDGEDARGNTRGNKRHYIVSWPAPLLRAPLLPLCPYDGEPAAVPEEWRCRSCC